MSPPLTNASRSRRSSSTSTTPPSEVTFTEDNLLSDAIIPPPLQRPWSLANHHHPFHGDDDDDDIDYEEHISLQHHQEQQQQHEDNRATAAINTDYESSAAEDYNESYTASKYENAECALLSYSRTNKLEKLQALLEAKLKNEISLKLNFKGQQKQNFSWSALHLACYFGHIQVVEQILSKKQFRDELNVNIQNNSGDTPLHKATLTNRAQIVQLLLSNGANVFIRNCDGLLAKQLTSDKHILNMLEAAEQVDRNRVKQEMFKAVDNGDLKKLQEYFENYGAHTGTFGPSSSTSRGEVADVNQAQQAAETDDPCSTPVPAQDDNYEPISQMVDERGNTLLHLAAMRGFKAICVHLLEHGFDPYRKNNLGQSCIDLASYQLRFLFTTVKPADNQLKRLSRQRVTRFEGPLLKKIRILGWKPIYVVLENGVILLFNNRRESMNKSRRGYKYLESATCEPDPNDVGLFTVCFSDKSRATFLVTSDHLNSYASFKFPSTIDHQDSGGKAVCAPAGNQVELVRQKWIDLIRDHIRYSTDFIKNGLKLNDYDDDNEAFADGGNLATLNHLLPIDTIKSFIQEARAHYSILERHAESLCNLVQSISSSSSSSGRFSQSMELSRDEDSQNVEMQPVGSTAAAPSASTTGSRLLGFISRSSRQARASSTTTATNDDALSGQSQQSAMLNNSPTRRRLSSTLTNEFVQDNWHCILFHLRLLMESTQNTKATMGQALALMEHQEQLRQNRIQDQDERCRVLEDSLHALARDHHELEKSLSVSQLYQSAAGRSVSMSTDLNEYFDAFEDFDDEKTMTPNSMPSDEDLNNKIQEVMNEGEEERMDGPTLKVLGVGGSSFLSSTGRGFNDATDVACRRQTAKNSADCGTDEEDEDDLRSNCSALTVETLSEFSMLNTTAGAKLASGEGAMNPLTDEGGSRLQLKHRTRLPSPMVPRDQVSIWSILKNCIGKELSKITMPVVFNEPLTMLQRACEGVQYSHYLQMADQSDDPVERMELICAFIVAGLSANCHRIIKPFNPLLYETYEYDHELEDGSHVKAMSQQVSHHPPITAAYAESDNFIYNGSVNPKIKFWGRSIEVQPDGQCRIYLKRHKESYMFKSVSCSIHNIIVGKLWFEHCGPLDIKCVETNIQANLVFKQAGWFSNDLHRFDGFIVSGNDKSSEKVKLRFVYGKWSDYIKSVDHSEYENYMRESQHQRFRIPDNPDEGQSNGLISKLGALKLSSSPNSVNNNSISNVTTKDGKDASSSQSISRDGDKKGGYTKSESTQSFDIPNSRTLWRLESQYLEEYYNFTLFTMMLNELTPDLIDKLPRTDSRFRPDVRKLEEGDLDGAANEKQRLEEKQRAARAKDKRFKEPSSDLLWFDLTSVPFSKDKFWIYKGGYWESNRNPEKFPDLF